MHHWKKVIAALAFVSLIGSYLGNFNNVASFAGKFLPENNPGEAFYGIWLSKYQYDVPNGVVEMHGTTEYFKNNSYNYVGEMRIKVATSESVIDLLYSVDGTGTWQVAEDSIVTQLKDTTSQAKSVTHNGVPIDLKLLSNVLGKDLPRLEDTIPKGVNEEFKIVSISDNELVLAADDPQGKVFEFSMLRQNRRFQR